MTKNVEIVMEILLNTKKIEQKIRLTEISELLLGRKDVGKNLKKKIRLLKNYLGIDREKDYLDYDGSS